MCVCVCVVRVMYVRGMQRHATSPSVFFCDWVVLLLALHNPRFLLYKVFVWMDVAPPRTTAIPDTEQQWRRARQAAPGAAAEPER